MTKENRRVLKGLFSMYEENKRYLRVLESKTSEEWTEANRKIIAELKKKVDVVEKILLYVGIQDSNKKKFVERHLIDGVSQKNIVFSCYVSDRTLCRWVVEVLELAYKLLNETEKMSNNGG